MNRIAYFTLVYSLSFSFAALSQTPVALGTGTTQTTATGIIGVINPFDYAYHTQFVYLASELTGKGITGPRDIIAFGVYVEQATDIPLQNFTIKIKHTTTKTNGKDYDADAENAFIIVYSGTYTPKAGGFDPLPFSVPFTWNGTGNLLIDICYFGPQRSNSSIQGIARIHKDATTNDAGYVQGDISNTSVCNVPTNNGTPLLSGVQKKLQGQFYFCCYDSEVEMLSLQKPSGGSATYVTIRNNGTIPLTNVQIGWSVNGKLQQPYSWTGNLAKGQSSTSFSLGSSPDYLRAQPNMLKIWTGPPNGNTDKVHMNDTLNLTIYPGFEGIYTISADASGPLKGDFKTLTEVVNALRLGGVLGATLFNIVDTATVGDSTVYQESISIPAIPGTSAVNTITFQSESGNPDDVVIEATLPEYTVQLNGADYVSFKNLTLVNYLPTPEYDHHYHVADIRNGSSNSSFTGNTLIHSANKFDPKVSVINVQNPGSSDTSFRFIDNLFIDGQYGLVAQGTAGAYMKGLYIQNNSFEKGELTCIYVNQSDKAVISGNHCAQSAGSNLTRIAVYQSRECVIERNEVLLTTNAPSGLYVEKCTGTPANPVRIANNFIWMTGNTVQSGMLTLNCNQTEVAFNSININGTNACYYSQNDTAIRIIDNSFFNKNANIGLAIRADHTTGAGAIQSDYNNLKSNGTALGKWNNKIAANLVAWRDSSGQDTHSLSLDPGYVSDSDLHTFNPALDGKGTPVTGISTDIDEELRDATFPDIGADEFGLGADGGAQEFISPVSNAVVKLGQQVKVRFVLKNTGSSAISNFPISYQAENGAPVTQNYANTLSTYATDTVEFTVRWQPDQLGMQTLCVWTEVPADIDLKNDTICIPVIVEDTAAAVIENIAIIDFLSPSSTFEINKPQTVTLRLRNVGNKTITAVPLELKVNGATEMNGTFSGTIAPFGEADFTFSSSYQIAVEGDYIFEAISSLTDDADLSNDTLKRIFKAIKSGVSSIDGGVTGFVSPSGITLEVNKSVPVTVELKNYGTGILSNIPVTLKIDGQVVANETYSGTLAASAKVDYTFSAPFVPTETRLYCLEAYTGITGDTLPDNDTTVQACFDVVTGIEPLSGEQSLSLYPNPAQTVLVINMEHATDKALIAVYTIAGKPVLKHAINPDESRVTRLDISALPQGMYYLQVQDTYSLKTGKFMIAR